MALGSDGNQHRSPAQVAELGTAKGPTSLRRENQRRGAVRQLLREDLLQGETEGGIRQKNGILEKYLYIYLFIYLFIYLLIYLFIYLFI